MLRITFGIIMLTLVAAAPLTAGLIPDWGKEYGDEGTIDRKAQEILAVETDDAGNIYIAGQFRGQIDLGGATLFSTVSNQSDFFVAKLSSTGAHLWSLSGGGTGTDFVQDIAVAPAGGVAVVGQTTSPTFTVAGTTDTTNGGADAFVMLFGSTGTHTFTTILGGTLTDVAHSVVWDTGNLSLYVSGTFRSTVDFGVGAPRTSNGFADFFLADIKIWGTVAAVGTAGGTGNEMWTALCQDAAGNLGFAGTFEDTINFGNGPLASTGQRSTVVAKIPSIGSAATWSQSFGNTSASDQCWATSVTTDGAGFFVTGFFDGSANMGSGTHTSAGDFDVWVGAYKASGTPVWSRTGGSGDLEVGNHIDYHDGLLAIAGQSEGPGVYDSKSVGHAGRLDALLLVYDVLGNIEYAKHGGGVWNDGATQVAIDSNGIYLVGGFGENAGFSGLTLNALDVEPDGFIVNYVENEFVGVEGTILPDMTGLSLGAPQPNPFHDTTIIEYGSANAAGIRSAEVYDVTGRLVRTLSREGSTQAGLFRWDGRNDRGAQVSPGIYFVRATDGESTTHRRVTVLR